MTVEQPEAESSHRAARRPARPARPADAAARGGGSAKPGAPAKAEAAEAIDPAQADGAPEAGGQDKADLTEVKRKFREALQRKRDAQATANTEGAAPGTGKVHGSHGPAASRRSFRRKSG
jgi:Family of unknown function (DUF5302)